MDNIIKTIRRFGGFYWWSFWNSKTWNNKQEGRFFSASLESLAVSLVQPVISSVVKGIRGGVRRARRGYMIKKF